MDSDSKSEHPHTKKTITQIGFERLKHERVVNQCVWVLLWEESLQVVKEESEFLPRERIEGQWGREGEII